MSFLLTCPNCGKRPVAEFAFQGEYKQRPEPQAAFEAWSEYVYMAKNHRGRQLEWWFHRSGCQRWFLARRSTVDNTDHVSFWFHDLGSDV